MKQKIFIDGKAGTTGLRIYERLAERQDITLLTLPETERKDPAARKQMLNKADVAFLCLPDAAAIEAVGMIDNPDTVVIDTSTAHRTDPAWVYGFPEVSTDIAARLPAAKRIAVPGCHASGFIALVRPLIDSGLLSPEARITCHSVTGYSGGGKKMIEAYHASDRSTLYDAPRQYALKQDHKHLPEMTAQTGLHTPPIFCPIVADFYSGMAVTVPLFIEDLSDGTTREQVETLYRHQYTGAIVRYTDISESDGTFSAGWLSGRDGMDITVLGNAERLLLIARYDNLGKGASGAAIEALNMVLGVDPTYGLVL